MNHRISLRGGSSCHAAAGRPPVRRSPNPSSIWVYSILGGGPFPAPLSLSPLVPNPQTTYMPESIQPRLDPAPWSRSVSRPNRLPGPDQSRVLRTVMPIFQQDIIQLPGDEALLRASIHHALLNLPHLFEGWPPGPALRLHQTVAQSLAELGLRRWLAKCGVRHSLEGSRPLSRPQSSYLKVGGRRVSLQSGLVRVRPQTRRPPLPAEWPHGSAVHVPVREVYAPGTSNADVLVFAYVLWRAAQRPDERASSSTDRGEGFRIALPSASQWRRPDRWRPLGKLAVENRSDLPCQLELGGQLANRCRARESLTLSGGETRRVETELHSLLYVRVHTDPPEQMRIRSLAPARSWFLGPGSWQDIWLRGAVVFATGWLTMGSFRRLALQHQQMQQRHSSLQYRPGFRTLPASLLQPMRRLTAFGQKS